MSRLKAIWSGAKKFLTAFPKWFGLYLGLVGLVFFNLFILEEAQQQVVFSTWNAKTANDWPLIKKSITLLQQIHNTSETINKYGGWINPLGYLAYDAYNQAEIQQIKSLKSMVFANAPELFAGEIVTFTFIPQEEEPADGYTIYRNGVINVMTKELKPVVTGRLTAKDGQITIDAR